LVNRRRSSPPCGQASNCRKLLLDRGLRLRLALLGA
jgi:hypothetical protein